MGARMSLKMHFLHSHLEYFPGSYEYVNDEHGERFHQDIKTLEERYHRNISLAMLATFVVSSRRYTDENHRRKRKCIQHF